MRCPDKQKSVAGCWVMDDTFTAVARNLLASKNNMLPHNTESSNILLSRENITSVFLLHLISFLDRMRVDKMKCLSLHLPFSPITISSSLIHSHLSPWIPLTHSHFPNCFLPLYTSRVCSENKFPHSFIFSSLAISLSFHITVPAMSLCTAFPLTLLPLQCVRICLPHTSSNLNANDGWSPWPFPSVIFLTAEFCMMEEKGKFENRAEFIVEGLKATGSHY